MNELFICQQQPRVTELDPNYAIAAARAMPDYAWSDPRTLMRLFYPLVLLGA